MPCLWRVQEHVRRGAVPLATKEIALWRGPKEVRDVLPWIPPRLVLVFITQYSLLVLVRLLDVCGSPSLQGYSSRNHR